MKRRIPPLDALRQRRYVPGMHCAFCRSRLGYVHGHAACLDGRCPMFGVNQAECCSGDHGDCPPTSMVASVNAAPTDGSASARPKKT